eukprot:tig00001239_g7769.t1
MGGRSGTHTRADRPKGIDANRQASTSFTSADSADGLQLPDAVLGLIFERLGLLEAAAARAVCRRWRQAIESVQWSSVHLVVPRQERVDQLAAVMIGGPAEAAAQGGGAGSVRRWIRIGAGASLRLEHKGDPARRYLRSQPGTPWGAALALVSACASASGGLSEVDLYCSRSSRSCLGELLRALAPPASAAGGAPAPAPASGGALRSIVFRGDLSFECQRLPAGAELEGILRPFPNLERLELPACCSCSGSPQPAAVLVRCLPRLKQLRMNVWDYEAAEPLASLGSLGRLEVRCGAQDATPLLAALAAGPAARSLRELHCSAELSSEALRALPKLAALERLSGPFTVQRGVSGDELLAGLGACPALRSFGPLQLYPVDLGGHLAGLRTALERSPKLALRLYLHSQPSSAELPELAALARAAAGGRLDLELRLDIAPGRPAPAEAAAALAAAPPRALALSVLVHAYSAANDRLRDLGVFSNCYTEDLEAASSLLFKTSSDFWA